MWKNAPDRRWATAAPEDLLAHLALVDRLLKGGRAAGVVTSVVLLVLARGVLDRPVLWYSAVVLSYLAAMAFLPSRTGRPWPSAVDQVRITFEFYLIAVFLYLSGQFSSHLNLILAIPAVGYAARYGERIRLPVIMGTLGASLFLLARRVRAVGLVEAAYVVVEMTAILGLSHLTGRSSQRMFWLAWSLSQAGKRSSLLLEVSHYVNESLAVGQTLQDAADQIRRLFGYRPAFFLYDAGTGELVLKVTQIFSQEEAPRLRFSPRGTLFEDVMVARQSIIVKDIESAPRLPEVFRGRIHQKVAVIMPLEHDGEFLGTMNVGKADEDVFTQEELELLTAIARLLSQAVFNARQHEAAERLSVIDELTGLHNHRYFQAELESRLRRLRATGRPLTLAMLDLDDFKAYNDLFGHQQGDEVLRQVGGLLALGSGDDPEDGFAARYGGEEFVMVLPGGAEEAWQRCEAVRERIAGYPFPGCGALEGGRITISIGAALFPAQAEERDSLIAAADTALYRAKHLGKNRCEFYTSVLDAIETDVLEESELGLIRTIKPLVSVINGKDNYTYGHSERVVEHAVALGGRLGFGPRELQFLSFAAFLHDLGKLEISRELLNKTEALTPEEWRTLQMHPAWGAEMVGRITSLRSVVPAIRHHHERWDGTGYPGGLKGEGIPLAARIIAVADAFDAMVTARPYRRDKTTPQALAEITANAGKQFDPQIAQAFCAYFEEKDGSSARTA